MAEQAQLFTADGALADTVAVEMTLGGKWPLIVDHLGRSYVLQDGRYVEAERFDADSLARAAPVDED